MVILEILEKHISLRIYKFCCDFIFYEVILKRIRYILLAVIKRQFAAALKIVVYILSNTI